MAQIARGRRYGFPCRRPLSDPLGDPRRKVDLLVFAGFPALPFLSGVLSRFRLQVSPSPSVLRTFNPLFPPVSRLARAVVPLDKLRFTPNRHLRNGSFLTGCGQIVRPRWINRCLSGGLSDNMKNISDLDNSPI